MLEEKKAKSISGGPSCVHYWGTPTGTLWGGCYQAQVTRPRNLLKVTQSMSGRPRIQTQGSL